MSGLEPGQDVELTHMHYVAGTANRGIRAIVRTVMAEEAIVEMTVTVYKAVPFEHLRPQPNGGRAEPPHDGIEEPLPEPVLPKEGTAVILGGDRRWAAVSDDGLIGGTLEPGARVTYQGEVDGRHEFSVPVVLRGYVPAHAIRLIEDEQ